LTTETDQRAYLRDEYERKDASYYSSARSDYVARLPLDPQARILEIGCGNGATGALALREGKCGSFIGVEMFAPVAAEAAQVLTEVLVGNVEEMDLPFAPASFDALIMSEVLEHLVNPEQTLARLALLIKPGGLVMASSPNIAHWKVIKNLIAGRFDYEESGVMDRTHLRWFTPRSFQQMFENAGITVDSVTPIMPPMPLAARLLFRLIRPKLHHLRYLQINLHGHRAG
jgi:2-polyprenyl-3-methyl-5-hydroxy-6-metoxy-1,4-benzoquinol methylase